MLMVIFKLNNGKGGVLISHIFVPGFHLGKINNNLKFDIHVSEYTSCIRTDLVPEIGKAKLSGHMVRMSLGRAPKVFIGQPDLRFEETKTEEARDAKFWRTMVVAALTSQTKYDLYLAN